MTLLSMVTLKQVILVSVRLVTVKQVDGARYDLDHHFHLDFHLQDHDHRIWQA